MSTMRAIVVSDDASLLWQTAPQPQPRPNELLVRVRAAGVNRADLLQRAGKYPPPAGASSILGLEIAGDVVASGAACSRFAIGERVSGLVPGGGYAEFAVIDEGMAWRIPDGESYEQAAALPEAFLTAFQALVLIGQLERGQWVLIHAGASGVGTAAIQICSLLGARTIVTASEAKCDALRQLGADLVLPGYDLAAHLESIQAQTQPHGLALVVDTIGPTLLEQHLKLLGVDGRLVMIALLGGSRLPACDLRELLKKRLSIIGTALRTRSLAYQQTLAGHFWDFARPHLNSGALRPIIGATFSIEDASAAHQLLESRTVIGKVVLTVP